MLYYYLLISISHYLYILMISSIYIIIIIIIIISSLEFDPKEKHGEGVQQGSGIQQNKHFQMDPLTWTLNYPVVGSSTMWRLRMRCLITVHLTTIINPTMSIKPCNSYYYYYQTPHPQTPHP